jgi:hypothetical protein
MSMTNFRAVLRIGLVVVLVPGILALSACAGSSRPDDERVTGDCKVLLVHCSSRQSTIDLDPTQRAALAALQERSYHDLSATESVTASAAALQALGFTVIAVNQRAGLVHAELDKVVATKVQRRRRALVKLFAALTGLPIQGHSLQGPDHESILALAVVRRDSSTQGMVVHIEFDDTVVDSKGNSRTTTPTAPGPYRDFFSAFADAAGRT